MFGAYCRKLLVSKKQQVSMFVDELLLSKLVLSYSPKSEQAWNHRYYMLHFLLVALSPSLKNQYFPEDYNICLNFDYRLILRLWSMNSHLMHRSILSRRWVIKSISANCSNFNEILGKESEVVEKIAEV